MMKKKYSAPQPWLIKKRYEEFITSNPYLSSSQVATLLEYMFHLTPSGFEHYVGALFEKFGYKVNISGGIDDKGIDIRGDNGDEHIIIQCKKHESNYVQRKDIALFLYDMRSEKDRYKDKCKTFFITTSRITLDARKAAKDSGVIVWDYKTMLLLSEIFPLRVFRSDNESRHPEWFRSISISNSIFKTSTL